MAPRQRRQQAAADAAAGPVASQADAEQQRMDSHRAFVRDMAVLMMGYTCARAAWHVGVPALFGEQPYVPLTPLLALLQALAMLLFWAGGGFAGAAHERPWLLNIYTLMSMAVVGKCVLDLYIYQFQPTLWPHFSPMKPWGVPALLQARLPGDLPGLEASTLASIFKWFEVMGDILCLLSGFKGVRANKLLMQARRAQKKAAAAAEQTKPAKSKKDE